MKRFNVVRIAILMLGLLALSCSQDPIFYRIAKEPAPIKPRIPGSPTNMVVFERNGKDILYVASGRIYWYADSAWDLGKYWMPQPEGKVISLAVAKNAAGNECLYALCLDGHSEYATLRYLEKNSFSWKSLWYAGGNYPYIQSIYADNDQLFASARNGNASNYAILYLDSANRLSILKENTAMLSGATYRAEDDGNGNDGIYYLSTRSVHTDEENTMQYGVFQVSEKNGDLITGTINPLANSHEKTIMNMIRLDDADSTIIALERRDNAPLYTVHNGSLTQMAHTTGGYATGAIAVWEDYLNPDRKMLVVGIQGNLVTSTTSSYNNGYVEFGLKADGSFDASVERRSKGSLQSLSDNDSYSTTLGKHPINHLLQTPKTIDNQMIFFASTQAAGLWSCRDRDNNGNWEWNAEN